MRGASTIRTFIEPLRAGAAAIRRRVWRGPNKIWLTGLLVALLAWQTSFGLPSAGPDPSWVSGLYMGIHDGKDFGSEIVFTYGPLGFLAWPVLWFSWLAALAYLFTAAIFVVSSVVLTWTLERSLGLLGAALVAFLYLATIPDGEQLPLVLAVALCFMALRKDRPASALTLLALGGGALSAIEILVKVSVGPLLLAVCLLGLAGARASRRQWLQFASILGGGLLALWLLAGQPVDSLWSYAANGIQIASGYNEAMGIDGASTWEGVFLVAFALGLVAAAAAARFRDKRACRFAIAIAGLAGFSSFKYGIVRFEPFHLSLALTAMLGIWFLFPWPRQRAGAFLAASLAIGAIAIHVYPTPLRLDVIANLKVFGDATELLVRPGRRQQLVDQSRAALQATYGLDPETLAVLGEKRVAVDPWEIAVAWAYELNWQPLPVFQDYTAYTSALDRLNAAAVAEPDGPEAILRQNPGGPLSFAGVRSIESRLPAWDPPQQNFAIVCNFVPARTAEPWQVLLRTRNRCGSPRSISRREAEPGETVAVPRASPGELVLLRLHGAEVEGPERLSSLLWRPQPRFAVLDDGRGTYRIVPGTSGDGLIVARDPALDGHGPFAQLPDIAKMRIEGAAGPLQFHFYRVKVRPAPKPG